MLVCGAVCIAPIKYNSKHVIAIITFPKAITIYVHIYIEQQWWSIVSEIAYYITCTYQVHRSESTLLKLTLVLTLMAQIETSIISWHN